MTWPDGSSTVRRDLPPGRILRLQLADVNADGAIDAVRKLIERRVPDATLKEECATRLRYGLPSSAVASVLALLEDKSNDGLVQDYQLGQTTLEEVFLRFAEGGEEDE